VDLNVLGGKKQMFYIGCHLSVSEGYAAMGRLYAIGYLRGLLEGNTDAI
jgi:D-mannonate dehydratase